jgi:hypothetical protein
MRSMSVAEVKTDLLIAKAVFAFDFGATCRGSRLANRLHHFGHASGKTESPSGLCSA